MQSIAGPNSIDWRREGWIASSGRSSKRIQRRDPLADCDRSGARSSSKTHGFDASDIETVEVDVFDIAHRIIGGGEEGDKTLVFTKEDADHSLPYFIAVALPRSYRDARAIWPERMRARRRADAPLSRRRASDAPSTPPDFPAAMPSRVTVTLRAGACFTLALNGLPRLPYATSDVGGCRGKVQNAWRIGRC